MLIFNLYFLSSLANPRKTSTSRIFAYYTKTRRLDAASFSSSLNYLVYGFKSIPCLSFGSRNGDSIAKIGGYGIRCMIDGMNMASILVMAQY